MKKTEERTKGAAELAERDCVPCKKGAKPLQGEALAGLLWKLDDWTCVKQHHLTKEWKFKDFAQALAFVNKVGAVAEEQGHHPDLFLKWGLVRAEIYTHVIDGLSENDFVLAAKIDRLRKGPGR
jgi:4a-hydroxytetrahydrobiopterin dehydratase